MTGADVLVGGTWGPGDDGVFDVRDPADDALLAQVADASPAQATAAVDAAVAAGPAWAATSPRVRSEVLRRAYELLVRDTEPLAALVCAENGKALAHARAEVAYAAESFRWFAEEAVRADGSWGSSPAGGVRNVVTARPVGVAALVTPWDFPAAMATRKLAPALAAGCTVVLKPAAETPLTALAATRLLEEAGVPPGVVNVVPTTGPPWRGRWSPSSAAAGRRARRRTASTSTTPCASSSWHCSARGWSGSASGGGRPGHRRRPAHQRPGRGARLAPVLLADVAPDALVVHEEVFAPVAPRVGLAAYQETQYLSIDWS